MNTYAFIVTYNRLNLLKKTVDCLRKQTHQIKQIIVINNSSTDGTEEWLLTQDDLFIITQENSGGAGGFHTGVKYCYEQGADWIWMMDDDVFPDRICLETLFKYTIHSGCLQPLRYYSDDKLVVWYKYFSLERKKEFKYDNISLFNKEFSFVNSGCFEGMLINRNIVDKIGFPDKRFFIAGDDTIYGYLANRHTNICVVKDAKLIRAKKSTDANLSPMYIYYIFRNFHLFEEYFKKYFGKDFYPLKVKIKYYLTGIYSCYIIFWDSRYSISYKYSLIRSVIKGIKDSKRKLINHSFN